MTETLEPATAAEIYAATIEPPERGTLKKIAAGAADLVTAAAGGGPLELSSAGDVVVRRLADGVEELRVPGGPAEEAAITLDQVRTQLDTMSPEEFRTTWNVGG
ncbi:hypothetical protein ABFT23_15965 [Nocardioides sp. C4-1]|uniref:hypothetical protein n=1 Tax=Nocardioides sp. C4-1 TaxID=3151851 RepID=UPI00326599D2